MQDPIRLDLGGLTHEIEGVGDAVAIDARRQGKIRAVKLVRLVENGQILLLEPMDVDLDGFVAVGLKLKNTFAMGADEAFNRCRRRAC